MLRRFLFSALFLGLVACDVSVTIDGDDDDSKSDDIDVVESVIESDDDMLLVDRSRLGIYAPFTLTADLSGFSDNQREMISLLIDASEIMDDLFWKQAYGDKKALLETISDPEIRTFVEINYGPWDRLDGDKPFLKHAPNKRLGARFYPGDMKRAEFENADFEDKDGLYSLVRRRHGDLATVPYSNAYANELARAALLLEQASELAGDEGFANYLKLRAEALRTDDYQPSDMAWMDMKTNLVELVIGPIETYEDQLFGYRAAFESYVLIKDPEWSGRLSRFVAFLPELQRGLPVPDEYKREEPGSDSDLNAYDAVYYAGNSNAGSKTIAINLPNDEQVQLEKGTRRLQIKNAMRAKFDKILEPIADVLIDDDQRDHITFDAFFSNTMFHEVAHGLGIKNTLSGEETVREALKETSSPMEEGKADILGLYMITELHNKGELPDTELMDHYVTFLAGIFRSIRFGASSAHGRANMVRFNYFAENSGFERDPETGRYSVNFEKMQQAIAGLSNLLLVLQGDGDYEGAKQLLDEKGVIGDDLAADLARLAEANIPVDIVFVQGKEVLGL